MKEPPVECSHHPGDPCLDQAQVADGKSETVFNKPTPKSLLGELFLRVLWALISPR
jgi:hypothetical protein